jgi:hypothetical protein
MAQHPEVDAIRENIVLKWAMRYHVLQVSRHDSIESAVASAYWAAEDGREALMSIEVIEDGASRVIPAAEALGMFVPLAPDVPQPTRWFDVELQSLDGTWAVLDSFETEPESEAEARLLHSELGERVRWTKKGMRDPE